MIDPVLPSMSSHQTVLFGTRLLPTKASRKSDSRLETLYDNVNLKLEKGNCLHRGNAY